MYSLKIVYLITCLFIGGGVMAGLMTSYVFSICCQHWAIILALAKNLAIWFFQSYWWEHIVKPLILGSSAKS